MGILTTCVAYVIFSYLKVVNISTLGKEKHHKVKTILLELDKILLVKVSTVLDRKEEIGRVGILVFS